MPKAIIFDKDGTLFGFTATWAPWCASLLGDLARDAAHAGAMARAVGFDPATGTFAEDSPVIAGTTQDAADLLLPHLPGWSQGALIAHLVERPVTPIPVCPLAPLLDGLIAAGHRLAVMTNDAEAAARAQIAGIGLADRFEAVLGYDSGHGAKPEAAPLRAIAAMLDHPAEDCLMVGDSLHDLRAGRAAGMATLGVLTGIAGRAALAEADHVAASIAELPALLGRDGPFSRPKR